MNNLSNTYARSPIPLYLQVAATLRRRIEDGYWKANERISTLEELEAEFQVARVTVRLVSVRGLYESDESVIRRPLLKS